MEYKFTRAVGETGPTPDQPYSNEDFKKDYARFVRLESRNFAYNSKEEEVVWDEVLIDAVLHVFIDKGFDLKAVTPQHLPHVMQQVADSQEQIRKGEKVEISLD